MLTQPSAKKVAEHRLLKEVKAITDLDVELAKLRNQAHMANEYVPTEARDEVVTPAEHSSSATPPAGQTTTVAGENRGMDALDTLTTRFTGIPRGACEDIELGLRYPLAAEAQAAEARTWKKLSKVEWAKLIGAIILLILGGIAFGICLFFYGSMIVDMIKMFIKMNQSRKD